MPSSFLRGNCEVGLKVAEKVLQSLKEGQVDGEAQEVAGEQGEIKEIEETINEGEAEAMFGPQPVKETKDKKTEVYWNAKEFFGNEEKQQNISNQAQKDKAEAETSESKPQKLSLFKQRQLAKQN